MIKVYSVTKGYWSLWVPLFCKDYLSPSQTPWINLREHAEPPIGDGMPKYLAMC